jgi:hypothetical protein
MKAKAILSAFENGHTLKLPAMTGKELKDLLSDIKLLTQSKRA